MHNQLGGQLTKLDEGIFRTIKNHIEIKKMEGVDCVGGGGETATAQERTEHPSVSVKQLHCATLVIYTIITVTEV